ncbi:hypothetical protein A2U01_0081169, partial [Trifolium medium]|nr:hypothetical protein [Trifolium medium]
ILENIVYTRQQCSGVFALVVQWCEAVRRWWCGTVVWFVTSTESWE